jgi:hypothetical protein
MLSLTESLFHLQIYDCARPFSLSRKSFAGIVDLTKDMPCSTFRCDRQSTLFHAYSEGTINLIMFLWKTPLIGPSVNNSLPTEILPRRVVRSFVSIEEVVFPAMCNTTTQETCSKPPFKLGKAHSTLWCSCSSLRCCNLIADGWTCPGRACCRQS